jgi:uncharacterized integral membrane protein
MATRVAAFVKEASVRWVHLTVILVFAAAVIIFATQNLQPVTVSFMGFSANTRLAILVAIIYVLGTVTGGSLWALLRRSVEAARGRTTA